MIYRGSCDPSGDFDGRWPIKEEAEGKGREGKGKARLAEGCRAGWGLVAWE